MRLINQRCPFEVARQLSGAGTKCVLALVLAAPGLSAISEPLSWQQQSILAQSNSQQGSQNLSPAERASKNSASVDKWVTDFRLDPAVGAMMKDVYQKAPQTPIQPSPSIVNFVKQQKRAQSVATSSPPSDFPAPVFEGANTRYQTKSPVSYSDSKLSLTTYMLQITTSASTRTVGIWYRSSLAQAGWQVIDIDAVAQKARDSQMLARIPGGMAAPLQSLPGGSKRATLAGPGASETIMAKKSNMQCTVQIIEDRQPPRTEVYVSVGKPQG